MARDANKLREAASILGKIGGPRGGHARAEKLSPGRRKVIARKAAQARWARVKDQRTKPAPLVVGEAGAVPSSTRPSDRAASGTISEMVRRIVEHLRPERVILFGSYATGLQGPDSDVDLLVIVRIKGAKRSKEVELYRLLAGIGLPKDIVIVTPDDVEEYRHVPGTIIRSALLAGKVLYERSA